jgi:hypothetical protein
LSAEFHKLELLAELAALGGNGCGFNSAMDQIAFEGELADIFI